VIRRPDRRDVPTTIESGLGALVIFDGGFQIQHQRVDEFVGLHVRSYR